jgi:hypothetical protein
MVEDTSEIVRNLKRTIKLKNPEIQEKRKIRK